MHIMHCLIWEQWHQSRRWVVGSSALLFLMMLFTYSFQQMLQRILGRDLFPLDKVSLAVGITAVGLLFVNERVADVSLQFPRRLFTLPCRPTRIVLSQLFYRSLVAMVLGVVVTLYQRQVGVEATLLHGPTGFLLAFVAGAQALILVAALVGTQRAIGSAVAAGVACLLLLYWVNESLNFTLENASLSIGGLIIVCGWGISIACAPLVRHGAARTDSPMKFASVLTLRLHCPSPVILQWRFASPAWAQCWFEWRRVLRWLPLSVLAAATGGVALTLLLRSTALDDMVVAGCMAGGLFAATACSYFLHRVSAADRRFLFGHPSAEQALIDGKLLAAGFTTLLTVLLATALIGLAVLLEPLLGRHHSGDMGDYTMMLFGYAAAIWVTLAAGPLYLLGLASLMGYGILARSVWIGCAYIGLGEPLSLSIQVILPGLICLLIAPHWRKTSLPVPWEVLPAILPQVWFLATEKALISGHLLGLPPHFWLGLTFPTLVLLAALCYARRIQLISWNRLSKVALGYFLVTALILYLAAEFLGYQHLKEVDQFTAWNAACFGALVCMPASLRLQRYW